MKRICTAGLVAMLAFPVQAGLSLSWEIHILDVEILSCTEPSVRNIQLLPRVEEVSDEQALAALPPGRIIRARVLRSKVVEEFLDAMWPPKIHGWESRDARQPTAFFYPVHVPARVFPQDIVRPVCKNFRRGTRRLMFVTTWSDCDTPGRMDLCLFSSNHVLYELTDHIQVYAGAKRSN